MKNFADRPSSDAKLPTNDFQVVSKARSWRHQGYIKASHSDLIDPYWWFKSLYVLHPTDDDHKQHFSLMRMVWKYHSADGTCQKLFSARSQLLSSTQLTSQLHRKIGIRVNKWSPAQPQILVMCADGHLFNYLFFKRNWSFSLGRGFSQCDPKNTQKKNRFETSQFFCHWCAVGSQPSMADFELDLYGGPSLGLGLGLGVVSHGPQTHCHYWYPP